MKFKKNLDLFLTFLKLGAITFGGGYAMISIIQNEIVEKKKWLSTEELMELTVVAESTPGPIAINAATFVGYKIGKFWGALFSTLGVTIPSLIIITVISYIFNMFISNQYVAFAFIGIKCAVCYLILEAGIKLFIKMKKSIQNIVMFTISIILLVLIFIFSWDISSIYFILAAGVIGIFIQLFINMVNKNKLCEESAKNAEDTSAESLQSTENDKEDSK